MDLGYITQFVYNIKAKSWRSVSSVEEIGISGEDRSTQLFDKMYHITSPRVEIKHLVGMCTDCIDVRCDFRVKAMFDLSLYAIESRRVRVLFARSGVRHVT